MSVLRGVALTPACLLAVVLVGCGGSGTIPETVGGARATEQAFLDDILYGRDASACALMTKQSLIELKQAEGPSCTTDLRADLAHLAGSKLAQIRRIADNREAMPVSVRGTIATATILNAPSRLVYGDGRWLVQYYVIELAAKD